MGGAVIERSEVTIGLLSATTESVAQIRAVAVVIGLPIALITRPVEAIAVHVLVRDASHYQDQDQGLVQDVIHDRTHVNTPDPAGIVARQLTHNTLVDLVVSIISRSPTHLRERMKIEMERTILQCCLK